MLNMGRMRLATGGVIMAALFGLTSGSALAQGMGIGEGGGFYIGAGGGFTSVDVCGDLVALGATSCDDEDVGFKIFGGLKFNQFFGAEIGYVDLGEVSASLSGVGVDVGADGFQVAAVGTYPIEQFSLLGKVGVFFWDAEASAGAASVSDDGTDIMFGVGGEFHFTPQLSVRGEWERYDFDGDDVDMFSASVIYRF